MENMNLRQELAEYTEQLRTAREQLIGYKECLGERPLLYGNEANVRIVAIDGLLNRIAGTVVDSLDLTTINQLTTDIADVLVSVGIFINKHKTSSR